MRCVFYTLCKLQNLVAATNAGQRHAGKRLPFQFWRNNAEIVIEILTSQMRLIRNQAVIFATVNLNAVYAGVTGNRM